MKKFIKRAVAMITTVMMFMAMCFSSYAEGSNHNECELTKSPIRRIAYEVSDTSVTEKATMYIQGEKINWVKVVQADGSFHVDITSDKNSTSADGVCNYQEILNQANSYGQGMLRGKDITNKNLKHVYLGTTNSTLTKSDLEEFGGLLGGATDVLASLAGAGMSSAVAAALANIAWTKLTSDYPDKVVYKSMAYEVRYKSDNNYYIHCYHVTARAYENGRVKQTEKNYVQSIGG